MDDSFWTFTIRIPKPRLRYSLRTFLFFVLISGLFASFLVPYTWERLEARNYYSQTYPVSDLLNQPPNTANKSPSWKTLVGEIKTTVAPHTWDDTFGLAAIEYFSQNRSIVVHQKKDVHQELTDLLATKRELAKRGKRRAVP